MCSEAWCTSGAMFKARSGARPPSTKELFQIIPMHAMNREIIPGRKRWFDGVLYNLWSLLTPWVAASRLLAAWHTQHQSPDWCCVWQAMPFSFSYARGVLYKYSTSCSIPMYPSSTLHATHTLARAYQFLALVFRPFFCTILQVATFEHECLRNVT